jgi:hypothetical protein
MSTTTPHEVGCPNCGTRQQVLLAESANVQRSPAWRQTVLAGTWHRFECEACALPFRVERDALYTDLHRGALIGHFPRTRFAEREALEAQIAETWAQTITVEAPAAVAKRFQGPGPRIVFGHAALREKVVCFDARLDDRLVEAVKLLLLEGIDGREEAGVADLVLVEVRPRDEALAFQPVGPDGEAVGDHMLEAPLVMYRELEADRAIVEDALAPLFEGLWVSWRKVRPDGLLPPPPPEARAEAPWQA